MHRSLRIMVSGLSSRLVRSEEGTQRQCQECFDGELPSICKNNANNKWKIRNGGKINKFVNVGILLHYCAIRLVQVQLIFEHVGMNNCLCLLGMTWDLGIQKRNTKKIHKITI